MVVGKSKCDYGWTELAGKCYKLFCNPDLNWNDARVNCFKSDGDLASLSHNKLNIVKEFLERVRVRLRGARTVSVGFLKIGQQWKWIHGENYNGNMSSKDGTKGRLVWSGNEIDWILEATSLYYKSDLYLCEKNRGEAVLLSWVVMLIAFPYVLFFAGMLVYYVTYTSLICCLICIYTSLLPVVYLPFGFFDLAASPFVDV